MMKYFFFFFILFSSSVNSQKRGQTAIDSLMVSLNSIKTDTSKVIILNLIAKEFKNVNPKQGIAFGNKALNISKNINWNEGIAMSLIYIGMNNQYLGEIDVAEKNFKNALSLAKNKINIVKVNIGLGNVAYHKTDLPKALEFYFKSLKLSEEIKDQNLVENCCYFIGDTYKALKNYESSLFYLNRSLKLNEKLNLKWKIASTLIIIGEVYSKIQKNLIAIEYVEKAKKISEQLGDEKNLLNATFALSRIYSLQGDLIKSLENLKISSKIASKINNSNLIAGSKLAEASTYIEMFTANKSEYKKFISLKKSEILILDVIDYCIKTKNTINLANCYEVQSELFSIQNKDKEAKVAIINYSKIKDSIFNEKSKETVKNLEDQRTIDLKNKQIEINKITIESKEKQKWLYIFGIGFLCILGGLLFYQNQNRKKTNKRLQVLNSELDIANKTKIRFLSILNHDLRSPVYNFIHFMQLQKESPELLDAKTKKEIEDKTILSAENLLFSMEDLLLWSKGQMDNFKPQPKKIAVQNLFDDTKNHFASEEKVHILFENPENIEINTDENFLKTIIRNLTGNAIKALKEKPEGIIIWKAYSASNKYFLSISDNGSGANQDQLKALYDDTEVIGIQSGLGLHLIRDLAKAIDCEISVDSKIGFGTTFTLKIT
jgi:signal transduction histidine kinase